MTEQLDFLSAPGGDPLTTPRLDRGHPPEVDGAAARLAAWTASRFPGHEEAVHRYLACGDAADTEHLSVERAVELVDAHLGLGAIRLPGTDLVQVEGGCVRIVTEDVDGLSEAVTMHLTAAGLGIRRLFRPRFDAHRDASGRLTSLQAGTVATELWIQAELIDTPADPTMLADQLAAAVGALRAAATDAAAMRRALAKAVRRVLTCEVVLPGTRGAIDLLRWLAQGNFEVWGYGEYALVGGPDSAEGGPLRARAVAGTGLGVLATDPDGFFAAPHRGDDRVLVITKDDRRAPAIRPGLCDYVGVQLRDASGRVASELRFIGRFTERADATSPLNIPVIRERSLAALARVQPGLDAPTADQLISLLHGSPRDELLGASADELASVLEGVCELHDRQQVRLFIRPDSYGRFLACQVYLPRERCTPDAVERLRALLLDATDGELLAEEAWSKASALARLYLVIHPAEPAWSLDLDLGELQDALACALETWEERFEHVRPGGAGDVDFGEAYRQASTPREAACDLRVALEDLASGYAVRLTSGDAPRLKVFAAAPVSVSLLVRHLAGLGVDVLEHRHFTWAIGRSDVHVYALDIRCDDAGTAAVVDTCLREALIGGR